MIFHCLPLKSGHIVGWRYAGLHFTQYPALRFKAEALIEVSFSQVLEAKPILAVVELDDGLYSVMPFAPHQTEQSTAAYKRRPMLSAPVSVAVNYYLGSYEKVGPLQAYDDSVAMAGLTTPDEHVALLSAIIDSLMLVVKNEALPI